MTVQISYLLHGGDGPEKGTISTCLAQEPVSVSMIKDLFPFEGLFHFRVKRPLDGLDKYLWMDLLNETDCIDAIDNLIEIQALILSLPAEEEEEATGAYLKEIEETLHEIGFAPSSRPSRRVLEPETIVVVEESADEPSYATTALNLAQGFQNIALSSVTKNAASLWSTVKSTATQFGMQLSTPIDNLNKIHTHFVTAFDDSVSRHVIVLQELWHALFPGECPALRPPSLPDLSVVSCHVGCPFMRESVKWKEAGWQKADPTLDTKNTGMLALRCMRYLGQTYPEETQRMVSTQRENIKTHYPFAVVGINLTLLLVDILGIKEKRSLPPSLPPHLSLRYSLPEQATSGYYEMFEDRRAFYEVPLPPAIS
jgi:hypothetical protein